MHAPDLRVLVVDDHEPMRAMMRKVLERAGVGAVRDAADGAAALALMRDARADIVILDHSMPGMSGIELMRALRADPAHADARLILLTGHASPTIAEAARAAGADAVLVKPVAPSALLQAIAAVVVRAPRGVSAASRS